MADLCSQLTISRLENRPDIRNLLRMTRAMAISSASFRQVPHRIALDLGDTFDAAHFGQQLRLFNAHFDGHGCQPNVVFDDEGRIVAAVLRPPELIDLCPSARVDSILGLDANPALRAHVDPVPLGGNQSQAAYSRRRRS